MDFFLLLLLSHFSLFLWVETNCGWLLDKALLNYCLHIDLHILCTHLRAPSIQSFIQYRSPDDGDDVRQLMISSYHLTNCLRVYGSNQVDRLIVRDTKCALQSHKTFAFVTSLNSIQMWYFRTSTQLTFIHIRKQCRVQWKDTFSHSWSLDETIVAHTITI